MFSTIKKISFPTILLLCFSSSYVAASSGQATLNVTVSVPVICKTEHTATSNGDSHLRLSLNSFCNTSHSLRVKAVNNDGVPITNATYNFDGIPISPDASGYLTLRSNAAPIIKLSYLDITDIPKGTNFSFQVETSAN